MELVEQLRNIVAQLAGLPPDSITADFSLKSRGLQSSVRRAALSAAIRRQLGKSITNVYTMRTFGELEAAVTGTSGGGSTTVPEAAQPKALSLPVPNGTDGLACGIDLEMVDALPAANDFWEHEFYKENFSHDEIAYCVLQENPRMHFAARWCAKEALIKCDPRLKDQPLKTFEVVRAASGEVSLALRQNGDSQKLPLAVSLSHTNTLAIAMVIRRNT